MKLSNKNSSIVEVVIGFIILIIIAFLSNIKHKRFDLTEEKRYSLSTATEQLLDSLNNEIYFKVYLAGDLQYDYKKLSEAAEDLLEEFKAQAGENVTYSFIDPNEDEDYRADLFKELFCVMVCVCKIVIMMNHILQNNN